jgi:hypothetical protein
MVICKVPATAYDRHGTANRRVPIVIVGDATALDEDLLDLNFDLWLHGDHLPMMPLEGRLGGISRPFEWPTQTPQRKRPNMQIEK